MKLRRVGMVFLASMSLVSAASVTAAAQAGAPTYCYATEIKHDVDGDLAVAAHDWCTIADITVHGNITVARNGDIAMRNVQVDGTISVATSGLTTAIGGNIAGSVQLTHADVLDLGGTKIQGNVSGSLWTPATSAPTNNRAVLNLGETVVNGSVDVRGPQDPPFAVFAASESTVSQDMRLSDIVLFYPSELVVGGSLILDRLEPLPNAGPPNTAQLCDVHVAGNATLEYSSVRIDWGGTSGCQYNANSVGGALLVHDNTGPVQLSGPVAGDLVCRRNLHHPHALHNGTPGAALTVGGDAIGQCAGLA